MLAYSSMKVLFLPASQLFGLLPLHVETNKNSCLPQNYEVWFKIFIHPFI